MGAGIRLVGLLNDDTNPVGAVHLGVVFEVEADGRPSPSASATSSSAPSTGRAVRDAWDRLETWSQLAAEALGIGPKAPTPAGGPPDRDLYSGHHGTSRAGRPRLALGLVGLGGTVAADNHEIARFELTGIIDQVNANFVEEALRVGAEDGAAAVLMMVDSPGGELTSMDRIIKAILASEVPVIVWVAPEGARAGSAATFVTMAADVAAMAPNTNIGAASVVGGGERSCPRRWPRRSRTTQWRASAPLPRRMGGTPTGRSRPFGMRRA